MQANIDLATVHIPFPRPTYSPRTQLRIRNARVKAAKGPRRAWLVGFNPRTRAMQYMVLSSQTNKPYNLYVYTNQRQGGYCYSLGAPPIVYITCSCEAAQVHNVCCRHAARVALRLEREAAR